MTDFPDVKLKTLVSFPATVLDGVGIDVTKVNGSYQFNLAYDDFAPPVSSITDPTNQNALIWNKITSQYALVPISTLVAGSLTPSSANPIMDGVAAPGVATPYSREDHVHPTDTTRASVSSVATNTAAIAAMQAAWTGYTPTITAASGTFTTVSATGRYIQTGKTVSVEIKITITTNGTAAQLVRATLPFTVSASGFNCTLSGRESALTGNMLQGECTAGGNIVSIAKYDNTYPGANSAVLNVSGVYESV